MIHTKPSLELLQGARILSSVVGSTLGPGGRLVLIEKPGDIPHATKDGVTVAKAVRVNEPVQQLAIDVILSAAAKTVSEAGDGTTTTTVLAAALFEETSKLLAAGVAAPAIARGINSGIQKILAYLDANTQSATDSDIESVALVSANNDKVIAKMAVKAVKHAGIAGSVQITSGEKDEVILSSGLEFPFTLLGPNFYTDPARAACILQNPKVLVLNSKLFSQAQANLLGKIITEHSVKSLVIVAPSIDEHVLNALITNHAAGRLRVAACRCVSSEDLADFAAACETQVYSKLEHVDSLGNCEAIESGYGITKNTKVTSDISDALRQRIVAAKAEADGEQGDTERLRSRVSRLAGTTSLIRVSGTTPTQYKERLDRMDDAVCASKSALKHGVLPGGGGVLALSGDCLTPENEDEYRAFGALQAALAAPLKAIASNVGKNGDVILDGIRRMQLGYDALNDRYVDMASVGIVDPAQVSKCAIVNAASAATMLLLTGATICVDQPTGYKES